MTLAVDLGRKATKTKQTGFSHATAEIQSLKHALVYYMDESFQD